MASSTSRTFSRIALAAALSAVGSLPAAAQEPIKIGFMAALSGLFSPIGQDMQRGAQLLVKQVGEIKGRKIELVVEDSEGKPAVALRKADRLVSESKVHALLGIFSSAEIIALGGAADKLGVPILTTNSGTPRATGERCHPMVFRSNPNDAMTVRGVADWLRGNEPARKGKWYIVAHDYEWGQGAAKAFKDAAAKMGVSIIGEDYAPLDTKDWSTYINKISAAGADYVWAPVIVSVVTDFIKQARSFGLLDKTRLLAVAGVTDSQLEAVGGVADGVMAASWATWTVKHPNMAKFTDAYWKEYKVTPGFQAILAYNGAGLLVDALSRAGSLSGADVAKALETAKFDGAYGMVVMRKFDHQASVPVFIGQVGAAPANQFGAKWAVNVVHEAAATVSEVPPQETGCKGL
ncbi:MAG: ABC transporter substrate-binding protein [Hyphomicrobiaceae bacterium]